MDIIQGRPLRGEMLTRVQAFLKSMDLDWDEQIETTFVLMDGGEIAATGSRHLNVLKCVAVAPNQQGGGLTATLISLLMRDAVENGHSHLFIYTKPKNIKFFETLGFYEIASTDEVVLLENRRNGIGKFVEKLPRAPVGVEDIGCIVANCNPFTKGHQYLVEQAAARCGHLYLFILSEQRSRFPAQVRKELAEKGTAHLENVTVLPTADYLVSSATFPEYFIKDKARAKEINCSLDIEIFLRHFARPLGIKRRFVGTEPFCAVTGAYNEQMKKLLPPQGVEVCELPRFEIGGEAVSASRVRALLDEGKLSEVRQLVPEATWRYLEEENGNGLG